MRYPWLLLPLLVACAPPDDDANLSSPIAEFEAPIVAACSAAKVSEVYERWSEARPDVSIACHLTLEPGRVITKRIVVRGAAASGVVIDCKGAMLDGRPGQPLHGSDNLLVVSRHQADGTWDRPENVTIKNCRINGSMRIRGWNIGEDEERLSSRSLGHTQRARDIAPKNVTIDNVDITAYGRTPIYVGTGTTGTKIMNSHLDGEAASVAIYLDEESTGASIHDNRIETTSTKDRERIAIDGSTYNKIFDNYFSSLSDGGIFLYRNCGERGVVRHTAPQFNQIIDNVFYYNHYEGPEPAIWLGARNGHKDYCGDDAGYPFGSSADDRDFARWNIVVGNQFYKRSVSDMIRNDWPDVNRYNVAFGNETVTQHEVRNASCWVEQGDQRFILRDGLSRRVVSVVGSFAAPDCRDRTFTCHDGELTSVDHGECAFQRVDVSCRKISSNSGCAKTISCPAGKKVIGATAMCDLELGDVTNEELAKARLGWMSVVTKSDHTSDGACSVDGLSISSGTHWTAPFGSITSAEFACDEHDQNGGDCQVRGALYCR
jgi:hypothetical protein